ncbi:hypothetical protein [Polaribacter sp.]|uniref:hypothetical protein n=1 Tax=Polaribacter sp. TaxID=1920175 RepID=UPI003F6C0CD2
MRTEEELLFTIVKDKLPKNVSLINEIADILNLNYDAAYRRIKGKTTLSLKEAFIIADHYNLNLNDILGQNKLCSNKIVVEKTHNIISDNFLDVFFDKSKEETQKVLDSKKGYIINCAKDYPFYHTDNAIFKKFRIFLFINILSKNKKHKNVTFSEFKPTNQILEKYNSFLEQYSKVNLIEVWNDSTLDNICNQIKYFYDVGLTTKQEAHLILKGLVDSLKIVEEQAFHKKRVNSNQKFELYYNGLVSLLNNILMKTDTEKTAFTPYTNLTYFKVTDKNTTDHIEHHLNNKLIYSKNISGEASVERKKFFNKIYQKIDQLKTQIF